MARYCRVRQPASLWEKPLARIGDAVSCPKHGDNHIATDTSRARDKGLEVAQHGDSCECGCMLISSLPTGGLR
ncbi:PAAR domain-containing protein [Paraburkholderia sp. BL17N1]|uniref:PAAR domain-containing protein n=1 Tax=Paraburkholderia sp. BL17N1 TaxID=1938798 RepID=UPI001F53F221|nr:PAAR domain-containing protein [Paraburkholderia sp. BL17N1]